MKTTTFNEVDFEQWKEAALQSLKGKPLESLITKTLEGIDLQPLYTLEDVEKRTHTARSPKKDLGWIVAQETYATNGEQLLAGLKESIARGNEALVFDGNKAVQWEEASLFELSQLMTKYPVFIKNMDVNNPILDAFESVPVSERSLVKGAISVSECTLSKGFSNLRTSGADLWIAHHKGADAVTELALALAQAANYADKQENFNNAAEDFFVHFAIDTHFFMEIAKLRAFRILWTAFCTAYKVVEAPYVPILTTTSLRSYSKLDPYVNLLRAGNEVFSAVLGGADVITVHPHDVLTGPSESSVRFARNIQLVIKEETQVDKVIDAAGGSYFIETLTSELVDKAWALFLEIEADGGYEIYVQNVQLEKLLDKRRDQVAKGIKSLIGTNVYAELANTDYADWNGIAIEGRLAEPFENLRTKYGEKQPHTVLVTFGELNDFKPRADFVGGFLATGGIRSEWSPAFNDAQTAIDWLANEKPDYAIVCATPTLTASVMEQMLKKLPDNLILDAAGKYDAAITQQWLNAGLNGFVFSGQDKVQKLQEIHSKWTGGDMR